MMRQYKKKVCLLCGKEFLPASGHQSWCLECRMQGLKTNKALGAKAYAAEHPTENAEHCAVYYANNREACQITQKAWRELHHEEIVADKAEYSRVHSKEAVLRARAWKVANPERASISINRGVAKHRLLGYIPLNQPFEGCNGHHVDREHVVYIPEVLHMSIRHNVWNGRNMDKINAAAFDYLSKQEVAQ